MDYSEKYYNLYQFFAGYLNQSWVDIYSWRGEEPTYQPVVRKYKTESERVDKAISELKEVMSLNLNFDDDDGEGGDILAYELGLAFYPPGVGLTYKKWLEDVLRILEEPVEVTRKEFIPERI